MKYQELPPPPPRGGADSAGIAEGTADLLAEGARALLDPKVAESLDPMRDTWAPWSEKAEKTLDYQGVGDLGWMLGVLFGLRDVEVPMVELRKLTGLSERAHRDFVQRLKNASLVETKKNGRTVMVTFQWEFTLLGLLDGQQYHEDEYVTRTERARLKQEQAHRHRRRKTQAEKLIYRSAWQNLDGFPEMSRDFWMRVRTDQQLERELVTDMEQAVVRSGEMLRRYLDDKENVVNAPEKPAEVPEKVLTSEERQAQYEACQNLLRRHGLVS